MAQAYKTQFNAVRTEPRILIKGHYVPLWKARDVARLLVQRDRKSAAQDRREQIARLL